LKEAANKITHEHTSWHNTSPKCRKSNV